MLPQLPERVVGLSDKSLRLSTDENRPMRSFRIVSGVFVGLVPENADVARNYSRLMPIASRSEHSKCDRGLHDLSDRGPTRAYPELPFASDQAHLHGSILPAKNQPVSAVRYLPSAKSAHEPSAIICPRNRANSIVARARIPFRVMTLPKILCNA